MDEQASLSAGAGGPVGSLDKRIEALEKLYATGESSGLEPEQPKVLSGLLRFLLLPTLPEPLAALFVAAVLAGT